MHSSMEQSGSGCEVLSLGGDVFRLIVNPVHLFFPELLFLLSILVSYFS